MAEVQTCEAGVTLSQAILRWLLKIYSCYWGGISTECKRTKIRQLDFFVNLCFDGDNCEYLRLGRPMWNLVRRQWIKDSPTYTVCAMECQ
jgi:hypothetical protein